MPELVYLRRLTANATARQANDICPQKGPCNICGINLIVHLLELRHFPYSSIV